MAENTKIQWCDHTFNPWRGCTKIAAGCANCYADAQSKRNPGTLGTWGPNGTRVVASEAMWRQPIKLDAAAESGGVRRRVFCASLADVFEDWKERIRNSKGITISHIEGDCEGDCEVVMTLGDVRRRLFAMIDATPNLDWLILTKRPENIRRMWPAYFPGGYIAEAGSMNQEEPRPNVWLGTSIATQADAGRNIPELLKCRDLAAKLFVSAEPLIEPLTLDFTGINWVIVGGESGPHARPCNVAWIRSLVEQCRAAGVPPFVKQLGAYIIDRNDAGFDAEWNDGIGWPEPKGVLCDIHGFRENYQGADCRVVLRDPKGGDPSEWPADLRVREFPKAGGT